MLVETFSQLPCPWVSPRVPNSEPSPRKAGAHRVHEVGPNGPPQGPTPTWVPRKRKRRGWVGRNNRKVLGCGVEGGESRAPKL